MQWKKSKIVWYSVTTVIFAVLIYFADLGQLITALSSVNRQFMALAMISGLSFFLFVAYVWYKMFQKVGIEANYRESLRLFLGGNFMNSITPLGQFGGEPFMAYIVSKNTDSNYEKALSSVVSADLLNAVPLFTYLVAGLTYLAVFNTLTSFTLKIIYITIPTAIIASVIVYLVWFEDEILENFIFNLIEGIQSTFGISDTYIESAKNQIREIKTAFQEVGDDPKHLLKTLIVPHLALVMQFLSLYFILMGQGIDPLIIPTYFTLILSAIATFSPTPGGSGTFETAFSGLIMLYYPVGLDTALASALLFRLTTYWPGILIGYLALLSLKGSRKVDEGDIK